MNVLLYPVIFQLLPFFLLFYMGVEIYLRNPKHGLHRLTMAFLFSLSFIYVGEFLETVLPIQNALDVARFIKYPAVFCAMTLSLYFSQKVNRLQKTSALMHLLNLLPLAAIPLALMQPRWMTIEVREYGIWHVTQYSYGFAAVIIGLVSYCILGNSASLAAAYIRIRAANANVKERQRNRLILQGSILSSLYLVIVFAAKWFMPSNDIYTYALRPSYCILIWAFAIRYAMVKFDFLSSTGRRYELLFELSPNGNVLLDDKGTIVEANSAFQRMIGLTAGSAIGLRFASLLKPGKDSFEEKHTEAFKELKPLHMNTELHNAAGETYKIKIHSDYLEMDGSMYAFYVVQDMTEQKIHEEKLAKLAYQDELTGLANRRGFIDKLQKALEQRDPENGKLAVMMIDLDQFQLINDTLGHSAGDLLIKLVARKLEDHLPPEALVARLGGDEFAVLLTGEWVESSMIQCAEDIMNALNDPVSIYGKCYGVSASMGISVAPHDGNDVETLFRNADTAMYVAKNNGRSRYHLFAPHFKTKADQHFTLVSGLSGALAREELTVFYQPQIDLSSNRIFGVEALLRWNSEELGPVSPAVFIPIAEEIGVISPIGKWVLRTAVAQAKKWVEEGHPELVVSVNISAYQLVEPLFVANVAELLAEHRLSPCNLCLEITESVAISDFEASLRVCQQLVDLGVSLAIDDFGVGYSSLSMLNKFPFRLIKLDRSLVQDIAVSKRDFSVIRTIIEMSQHLGMQVVAEGVESEEQRLLLRDIRCHEAQGYLFGKPMSASAMTDYLSDSHKRGNAVETRFS